MDKETIEALSSVSNDGLLAVIWYSTITVLPDLIFVIGLIVGVRALWKAFIDGPPPQ